MLAALSLFGRLDARACFVASAKTPQMRMKYNFNNCARNFQILKIVKKSRRAHQSREVTCLFLNGSLLFMCINPALDKAQVFPPIPKSMVFPVS
jgi:hypothetical protein